MALVENDSILMSIKNLLNVEYDDMAFDTQIGMAINGEFMTLHQLGIGPKEGFFVIDADTKWSDFSDDKTLIETVKMYIYMKVRMIFDPPGSSVVADQFNNRIAELEFRLNVQAEKAWETYGKKDDSESGSEDPEQDHSDYLPNYTVDGENIILTPKMEISKDPFKDLVPSDTASPATEAIDNLISDQTENQEPSGGSTNNPTDTGNQNNQTNQTTSPNYVVQGENLQLFGSLF